MLVELACRDKSCLIVGSAPSVTLPVGQYDCVLGANGGAAIARDWGLEIDALVTTSHLFRDGNTLESEKSTIEFMYGLFVGSMWVDTKNGSASSAVSQAISKGIDMRRVVPVSPEERSEVVSAACGEDLWVSTGVWAACLALVSGASSVETTGIDPYLGGHHGMDITDDRNHVQQDKKCLDILRSKGVITW